MVRILMFRLWPAFIPLILYVLWMLYRRYMAKKHGLALPAYRDGPWMLAVGASLILGMLSFMMLGLLSPGNEGMDYTPTRMKDGQLIQGGFD